MAKTFITDYYLSFITCIEKYAKNRTMYHVGDNFIIEVTKVEHDLSSKNSIMNLWAKMGYIPAALTSHIAINTYYYDADNNCHGLYNITHTKDHKIDFDYILEFTDENVNKLLAECIRMYEMGIE